jgi:hypothetical protein
VTCLGQMIASSLARCRRSPGDGHTRWPAESAHLIARELPPDHPRPRGRACARRARQVRRNAGASDAPDLALPSRTAGRRAGGGPPPFIRQLRSRGANVVPICQNRRSANHMNLSQTAGTSANQTPHISPHNPKVAGSNPAPAIGEGPCTAGPSLVKQGFAPDTWSRDLVPERAGCWSASS